MPSRMDLCVISPLSPTQDQTVSMILMASWVRPYSDLVKDWYANILWFLLVNSRQTLGHQPPNVKKDTHKREMTQETIMLPGM